jgi:short-subunit dehydrogenase involved in D-alanine esterification of teichoic acids
MERFIVKKGIVGDNFWCCTDQDNGVIVGFEQGKFDETKIITMQYEIKQPDVATLTKVIDEMVEWLKNNHPDKM